MENLQESIKASVLEFLNLHCQDVKEKLKDTVTPIIHAGINSAITHFIQQEVNLAVDEIVQKSMEEKVNVALEKIKNSGPVFTRAVTEIIQEGQQMSLLPETELKNCDSITDKLTANETLVIQERDTGEQKDIPKILEEDKVAKPEVNSNKEESGNEFMENPFAPGGKVVSSSQWSSSDDGEHTVLKTFKNPFATDNNDLSNFKKSSADKADKSALQVIKNPFDPAYKTETATAEVKQNPFAPRSKSLSSTEWSSADDEEYAKLMTLKNPFAPDGLSSFRDFSGEKANKANLEVVKTPSVPAREGESATPQVMKNSFAAADKGSGSSQWSSLDIVASGGPQQQTLRTPKAKRRHDAKNGRKQGRNFKTPYSPNERTL